MAGLVGLPEMVRVAPLGVAVMPSAGRPMTVQTKPAPLPPPAVRDWE